MAWNNSFLYSFIYTITCVRLVAQRVKHLPAMWETWVQFLGLEDPLEKEMALFQYSCLENPTDREKPVAYTVRGVAESDTTEWLHFRFYVKHSSGFCRIWSSASTKNHNVAMSYIIQGNLKGSLGTQVREITS